MSQVPPEYSPTSNFAALAEQPIIQAGLPGAEIDGELVRVGDSINQAIRRLSEIQRDDGRIQPAIVAFDNLAPDVLSILTATGAITAVEWVPDTAFTVGQVVSNPVNLDELHVVDANDAGLIDYYAYTYYAPTTEWIWDGSGEFIKRLYDETEAAWYWAFCTGTPESPTPVLKQQGFESYGNPLVVPVWVIPGLEGLPQILVMNSTAEPYLGTFVCTRDHTSGPSIEDELENWVLIASPRPAAAMATEVFVGDGSQTYFELAEAPVSKSSTQVYADGIYVGKEFYTLSGTLLTFDAAPGIGQQIEVVYGLPSATALITVADGGVTEAKIAAGAVTADKIAAGAVDSSKLAGTISGALLQDLSVIGSKLASGAVIAGKIGANAVVAGNIAASAVLESAIAANAVSNAKLANGAVTASKIASGPLPLNGEPTAATHATTKSYVDAKVAEDVAIAADELQVAIDAKASNTDPTLTGLTIDEAPFPDPAGTAPLYAARAFCAVDMGTPANKTGTYVRDGLGTVTVTMSSHGLRAGDSVYLDFTTGGGTDGRHTVVTAPDDNTFTLAQAGGAIASSNVTARFFTILNALNVSSVSDGALTVGKNPVFNLTTPLPSANPAVSFIPSAGYGFSDPAVTRTAQILPFECNTGAPGIVHMIAFA